MAGPYAGLDVSLALTSICVVDEKGRMVREAKVSSEPDAITRELPWAQGTFIRVGLEAGPLSQWLCFGPQGCRSAGVRRGAPCKGRNGTDEPEQE